MINKAHQTHEVDMISNVEELHRKRYQFLDSITINPIEIGLILCNSLSIMHQSIESLGGGGGGGGTCGDTAQEKNNK